MTKENQETNNIRLIVWYPPTNQTQVLSTSISYNFSIVSAIQSIIWVVCTQFLFSPPHIPPYNCDPCT